MNIPTIDSTCPGIEPIFSLTVKRHYVQRIDYSRSTNRGKLRRKQFRNKLLKLKVSDLIYVQNGPEKGNFQGAIVLKACPYHFDVYGQQNQKFFSIGSDGFTWMTVSEYEKTYGNQVSI